MVSRLGRCLYPWVPIAAALLGLLVGACASREALPPEKQAACLLQEASERAAILDFAEAYDLFRRAADLLDEGTPSWQQATYGQAVCCWHTSPATPGAVAEADARFRRLLAAAPDSVYAPAATLNLGRIAGAPDYFGDTVDYEAARARYREVVERWPDRDIAGEATLRLASTYAETYEPDLCRRGIRILEEWLASHPDDPLASGMWEYMAGVYLLPFGDHRRALDCFIRADEVGFLRTGSERGTYLRMARIADLALGDREAAVRYYRKVIESSPNWWWSDPARRAVERLGGQAPAPARAFAARAETTLATGLSESTAQAAPDPPSDAAEPIRWRWIALVVAVVAAMAAGWASGRLTANRTALLLVGAAFVVSGWKVLSTRRKLFDPDKIAIHLAHWQLETGFREALQEIIDDYNAIHADDGVVVVQMPVTEKVYAQWLNVHLLSGDAPELSELGKAKMTIGPANRARYFAALSEIICRPNPYNRRPGTAYVLPPGETVRPRTPAAFHARTEGVYRAADGTSRPFLPEGLDPALAEELEQRPWRETLVDGMRGGYEAQLDEYCAVPVSFWGSVRFMYNKPLVRVAKAMMRLQLARHRKAAPPWLEGDGFPETFGQLMALCENLRRMPNLRGVGRAKNLLRRRLQAAGQPVPGWLAQDGWPEGPEHWESLCEVLADLDEDDRRPLLLVPIAGTRYVMHWMFQRYSTALTGHMVDRLDADYGGDVKPLESYVGLRHGAWSFDDPPVRAVFEVVRTLCRHFPHGFMGMGRDTSVHLFVQEEAVMRASGAWDAMSLFRAARFDVGVADFPLPGPGEPWGRLVVGRPNESADAGGVPLAVYKFSPHKDWAVDFVQFLTAHRWNQRFNRRAGWIPIAMGTTPSERMKPFAPDVCGIPQPCRLNLAAYCWTSDRNPTGDLIQGHLWKYIQGETDYDTLADECRRAILNPRGGVDRAWFDAWELERVRSQDKERFISVHRIRQLMLGEKDAPLRLRRAVIGQILRNRGLDVRARFRLLNNGREFPEF